MITAAMTSWGFGGLRVIMKRLSVQHDQLFASKAQNDECDSEERRGKPHLRANYLRPRESTRIGKLIHRRIRAVAGPSDKDFKSSNS